MYNKTLALVATVTTLILSGCATNSSSGGTVSDKPGFSHDVFNVEKTTCWELSTLAEEDAGYAATLIYGYSQGKQGDATQTPSKIESALSQISQKCAGNPDMLVISAFK